MSRAGSTITLNISGLVEKYEAEQRTLKDAADEVILRVTQENRDFTKDENAKVKEAQERILHLRDQVANLQRQAEINAAAARGGESRTRPRDVPPGRLAGLAGLAGGAGAADQPTDEERAATQKRYARAFGSYLRRGLIGLSDEDREVLQSGYQSAPDTPEMRALAAGTGSAGGYTIPQGFVAKVQEAMKWYGGPRMAPTTKLATDSGNDLPIPTVNDTTNTGALIAENTAVTAVDLTFGQVVLKAFTMTSGEIAVSNLALQDTGVDLEGLIANQMGKRIGRVSNTYFTTGTGTGQPQGCVTGATLGKTAASATAIAYGDLVDLMHNVDVAYRNQASAWMFHDKTLAATKKLVDGQGRPLWQPAIASGLADGAPGTLLGYPYFINNDMAQIATAQKTVLFGDWSNYWIRDAAGLAIVRAAERRIELNQTSFFGFARVDGRMVNAGTNPIQYLIQA